VKNNCQICEKSNIFKNYIKYNIIDLLIKLFKSELISLLIIALYYIKLKAILLIKKGFLLFNLMINNPL
jgi:hypothetical protein